MQKHIIATLAVVATLTAAHPLESIAQDAASKAAAVLAEARKALGGEDKLRAVKTVQASGDFRRSMGDMQMEGELELLVETPDKMRRDETIGIPGGPTVVRTEVLNGADVWEDSSQRGGMGGAHMTMVMRGPGGREMNEEQMKQMRRRMRRMDLSRYLLGWLLTTDAVVSHAGIAEAPDGKADILEIAPADGPSMQLFIDQQSHMPLMLTWKGPQPRMMVRRAGGGGPPPNPEQVAREAGGETAPPEAMFEMRFDEYRKVDGIQLPHLISRAVNGSIGEEWTVKSYTLNAPLKGNTFTK